MKKLILLLVLIFISCTNDNDCISKLNEAKAQYQTALQRCGASYEARVKVDNEYKAKVNRINSECN